MTVFKGNSVGMAVCRALGIDCKKYPVLAVEFDLQADHVAKVVIHCAIKPGFFTEIDDALVVQGDSDIG